MAHERNAVTFEPCGSKVVLNDEPVMIPEAGAGEVLLRMKSAAVNPLDWPCMRADPFQIRLEKGLLRPKQHRLGADFSGVVESVGEGVRSLVSGDEVLATTFPGGVGAFADCVAVDENSLVKKPKSLPFDEAATLGISALTALQGITRNAQLGPASSVLVNGASGGIGTFALKIAKAGYVHVTAVCSGRNYD